MAWMDFETVLLKIKWDAAWSRKHEFTLKERLVSNLLLIGQIIVGIRFLDADWMNQICVCFMFEADWTMEL